MPKTSAFIFDMDGTLVDNMLVHNQIWVDCLAELGVHVDLDRFNTMTAGKTSPEIIRLFLGHDIPETRLQLVMQEKETRYRDTYQHIIQPIPGISSFLDQARAAGIRLALATSAPVDNIDFVLSRIGLENYFEVVVSGEDVKNGKPDPEIFLMTAQRLNLPSESCLVFEDSMGGMQAARSAGMPIVVITTGLSAEQAIKFPGVQMTISDYTQLDLDQLGVK